MEEATTELKKFSLPNTKVTVRPVDRPVGAITDKKHLMYNMMPGATYEVCPRNREGSTIIDCPLTSEEIEFFENKKNGMALEPGDLSPYKESNNFWKSKRARVKLSSAAMELDLANPGDYIKYKILLSNSDIIAPSLEQEFDKKSYRFVMFTDSETASKTITRGDKKKRAWKIAAKLEDNVEGMIDYLSVVGKRPSANSKRDFLISEIDKQVETNIDEFLEVLEDPQYETRVLLIKSVQNKSVVRDGHKYFTKSGDPLCKRGEVNNLKNVLNYLDDDANQDIRLLLMSKLEKK